MLCWGEKILLRWALAALLNYGGATAGMLQRTCSGDVCTLEQFICIASTMFIFMSACCSYCSCSVISPLFLSFVSNQVNHIHVCYQPNNQSNSCWETIQLMLGEHIQSICLLHNTPTWGVEYIVTQLTTFCNAACCATIISRCSKHSKQVCKSFNLSTSSAQICGGSHTSARQCKFENPFLHTQLTHHIAT